ncbi:MAG: Mur ligase family protein, partial [Flammeovirgaceae bacterium]
MMFSELANICAGRFLQLVSERQVKTLLIDSRKSVVADGSVFFAIKGIRHDGHAHLQELYHLGIRQFVVEQAIDVHLFTEANILLVDSSIDAIQKIAAHHRSTFSIPIIGITGSNGKTVIKEWLYQLLSNDQNIAKNPGSYNSQVGVPLSVWQLQSHHQLGIFEAGISQRSEMEKLAAIIQPTIGIFTNIGTAHDEGFLNRQEKINEKSKLFKNVKVLIYCADHAEIDRAIKVQNIPSISWGMSSAATIRFQEIEGGVHVNYQNLSFELKWPFRDKASIENASHCVAVMLHFGYSPAILQERLLTLQSVAMRLELKQGINHCQLIDDTYNNDLAGLRISLDFLASQQKKKKTLILSDVLQSGLPDEVLVKSIYELVKQVHITRFIGIGRLLYGHQSVFSDLNAMFYQSTADFLKSNTWEDFDNELVLIKGARVFRFEQIVQLLQRKIHGTVMEIDLNKMVHNLIFFKSRLQPKVKLMAMVKAFAYGSGSEEVANLLQYHQVDYLGVAYSDEGVELRKNNIALPIMVMNPAEENFQS